ncbi:ABC transporter permease protein domain [Trypanosoma melophagium]|uniref:ABC transporter permease protein domain n=1 Tax=Trypanosoma melophagium TaxID=715481 RepID=UPI00351AA2D1|nr:ABC transporter permease protein domain [Trypanosoma melophagium]
MKDRDNSDEIVYRRLPIDLAPFDDHVSLLDSIKNFFSSRKRVHLQLGVFLKLAIADARASKVSYALNFLAVFIVVFFCVVMMSTLFNLPILFLRLGEAKHGENDLIITPGGQIRGASSFNYSAIEEIFPETDLSRGYHTPRITFTTEIVNFATCEGVKNVTDLWVDREGKTCQDGCMYDKCDAAVVRQLIISINRKKEDRMGFGSQFKAPKIGKGEVILSKNVAIAANDTKVGDTVLLYADVTIPLREVFRHTTGISKKTFTIMSMKVVGIVGSKPSKFDVEDFIIMNYDYTLADVAEGLGPEVKEEERQGIAEIDPNCCATSVHFNLGPGERIDVYKSTDYAVVRRRFTSWVSSIVDPLGFNQVLVKTPIIQFLHSVRFFSLFVGLIVSLILLGLSFLSLVLIYSLLNLSVERRIHETGIRRMIGFTRENLVLMLLTNVYLFTIPAWITGVIVGQLVYLGLRTIISDIIYVKLPVLIPGSAIGWATFAGLLLPLAGAIFPLLSLITNNLPESLSTTRGRNFGVKYKIVRMSDASSLNYRLLSIGTAFTIFGFLLYYFFPISMVQMQLNMLFCIFFGILVGMLVGLVMLALNFESLVQTSILYLFFFWEKNAVFQAVQKFLASHRGRNRKTTIIYAFSLGFTIFIAIAFQVQLQSFLYSTQREMGSEVMITFDNLNLIQLGRMAEYIKTNVPQVTDLTYASRSIVHNLPVQNVTLSTIGRYSVVETNGVRAIPPNFLDVVNKEFLHVYKYDKVTREYSISGALYTDKRNRVIIPTSAYTALHCESIEDPILLVTAAIKDYTRHLVKSLRFNIQPSAVLSSVSQFSMSDFKNTNGDILSSYPLAARFTGVDFLGICAITTETVTLRVPDRNDVIPVYLRMKKYLRNHRMENAVVHDYASVINTLEMADRTIGFFFIFTEIVTLLICFSSLFGGMTANVLESSKEIGIYRCIGMTKPQIYRIFIWEAFVVVAAGSIIGVIIGMIVGYSMQLQNHLFTQLHLPFAIPYLQLIIVFGMAVVAAVVASFGPVLFLMRLPSITHILRRVL